MNGRQRAMMFYFIRRAHAVEMQRIVAGGTEQELRMNPMDISNFFYHGSEAKDGIALRRADQLVTANHQIVGVRLDVASSQSEPLVEHIGAAD